MLAGDVVDPGPGVVETEVSHGVSGVGGQQLLTGLSSVSVYLLLTWYYTLQPYHHCQHSDAFFLLSPSHNRY